jgi:hypothetical protein
MQPNPNSISRRLSDRGITEDYSNTSMQTNCERNTTNFITKTIFSAHGCHWDQQMQLQYVYCQLTIPNWHHAFTPQTLIMQWDSILVDAIRIKRYGYGRNQQHTHIFFCFSKRMARAFTASCAGPGLVLLICSLYLTSSASSFLIFSSTVSPLLFICKQKKTTPRTENV